MRLALPLLSLLLLFPALSPALGKSVSTKEREQILKKAYARDLARDRSSKVTPNPRDRTVFRYTTKEQAKVEQKHGIAPGAHLTPNASRGRALSSGHAGATYGVSPSRAQVRETVRLEKGLPIKSNKAIGGKAGVGEVSSTARIPPRDILKIVPLPESRNQSK